MGLSADHLLILIVTVCTLLAWLYPKIPMGLAACIPMFFLPFTQSLSITAVLECYFDDVIWLFVGGMILSAGLETSRLHEVFSRRVVAMFGRRLYAVLLGFLAVTAFVTFWISNTATVLVMLPLVSHLLSHIQQNSDFDQKAQKNFANALYLGVAYAASIGGVGTLIGSPPNGLYAAFIARATGSGVSFWEWTALGMPLALCGILFLWLFLTRFALPFPNLQLSDAVWEAVNQSGKEIVGALTPDERQRLLHRQRSVLGVFSLMILGWIVRPKFVSGVNPDAVVGVLGGLLLIALPARGLGSPWRGERVVPWRALRHLPWQVLLVVGAGLAISAGVTESGLLEKLHPYLANIAGWPLFGAILLIVATVILITEIGSNTAVVAMFLPLSAVLAKILDVDVKLLALAVTYGGSLSFMLPMATPPNAAVIAKGHVDPRLMMRVGLGLNLVFAMIISVFIWLLRRFA